MKRANSSSSMHASTSHLVQACPPASTTSTSVVVPPTSSWRSNLWRESFSSRLPNIARRWTVPRSCGTWLNVAECQLSVLARQCLDQRIDSIDQLEQLLAAWGRNRKGAPIRWQFTTADARIKLRRLYPIISNETVH